MNISYSYSPDGRFATITVRNDVIIQKNIKKSTDNKHGQKSAYKQNRLSNGTLNLLDVYQN